MIKLKLSKQTEELRVEFKAWLEKNNPPKNRSTSLKKFIEVGLNWQKQLASANFVGVHWPLEYGGRSLSLLEEAIIQEELVQVKAPQILGLFGLTMVGPVLIKHGSSAQKEKFLEKILKADQIWCQGFSEPGAGSDLSALATKAEKQRDGFIINGQKIWTSFAHIADWCFLLARTSAEKYEGLSYLLVDMRSKGIKTRTLKQISGDNEFNEVFFDNVFVPSENLVGEIGQGWKIAISTLMFERVVLTFARQLQSEVSLNLLLKESKKIKDGGLIAKLAREIANACAIRAMAYQHLISYSGGQQPGPEGSLDKLFWSESYQSITKLALKFKGELAAYSENSVQAKHQVHDYLYSRGRTIAAGTSEIQRSIIAERLLGLPRAKLSV